MHTLTISNRELLMLDTALNLLVTVVGIEHDQWSVEDLCALRGLYNELHRIAEDDRAERRRQIAEGTD